jgi:hypothetical protein
MDRRAFLSTSVAAIALAASSTVCAEPSATTELAHAIAGHRMPLAFDGQRFSGAGYDWLLRRGAEAQAFLIGEEHGIAENAKLAAALFAALVPRRYYVLAIETSPPIAAALDQTILRGGLPALEQFVTTPGSQAVFFGLREEAEWLAAARAAVPTMQPLLWGLDYELSADRYLIGQLKARPKPAAAVRALAALEASSSALWRRYAETHNPQFIFSFAGDPALVDAVTRAWPSAEPSTRTILATLEETLAINRLYVEGKGYESNVRRSRFMRSNLLRYWRALQRRDPHARLFMKMGASHMIRGLSPTGVFDVGTLVPELLAERGGRSFHLLVLAGRGSETGNFDPTQFRYVPGHREQYSEGMDPFYAAAPPGGFTLFETAQLRPIIQSSSGLHPALARTIHGFDAILVMTGSHASTGL